LCEVVLNVVRLRRGMAEELHTVRVIHDPWFGDARAIDSARHPVGVRGTLSAKEQDRRTSQVRWTGRVMTP
jgi:hypothetical protein